MSPALTWLKLLIHALYRERGTYTFQAELRIQPASARLAVDKNRYLVNLVLVKAKNVCYRLNPFSDHRAAGTAWDAESLRGNVANENRIMVPVRKQPCKWLYT
jgi:hypothetical protein